MYIINYVNVTNSNLPQKTQSTFGKYKSNNSNSKLLSLSYSNFYHWDSLNSQVIIYKYFIM